MKREENKPEKVRYQLRAIYRERKKYVKIGVRISRKTENRKMNTQERLACFFLLASFKSPYYEDLGVMKIEEKNGIRRVSAKDIGLNSVQDWRDMMGSEIEWVFSHGEGVVSELRRICSESKPACGFLKDAITRYTQDPEVLQKMVSLVKKCGTKNHGYPEVGA